MSTYWGNQVIRGSKNGDLDALKRLISVSTTALSLDTICSAHRDCINHCCVDRCYLCVKNCAVMYAARNGHLEVVKYLISVGADITAENNWSLEASASKGHIEVFKFLVDSGADITDGDFEAIHSAAENGHFSIIRYSVRVGIDYGKAGLHTILGLSELPRTREDMLTALDMFLVERE